MDGIRRGKTRLRVKPLHENPVGEVAHKVDRTADVRPADAFENAVEPEGFLVGPFEATIQLLGGHLHGLDDHVHGVVVVPVETEDPVLRQEALEQGRARVRRVKRVARYIDAEILNDYKMVLDFNMAYHPSCAYNDKFICALPPKENTLDLEILAGEKNFK